VFRAPYKPGRPLRGNPEKCSKCASNRRPRTHAYHRFKIRGRCAKESSIKPGRLLRGKPRRWTTTSKCTSHRGRGPRTHAYHAHTAFREPREKRERILDLDHGKSSSELNDNNALPADEPGKTSVLLCCSTINHGSTTLNLKRSNFFDTTVISETIFRSLSEEMLRAEKHFC
jgi:hypothetical protein